MKVNMTPNPLDVVTIHASQGDTEARQWEFELHNNGELIDTSDVTEQMVFKSYKGGTEQILPENGAVPVTAPFVGDIKYPDTTRTDQEFLYRESPTEENGLAKIQTIYGNTLKWNQLVQNGNFADTTGWASASTLVLTIVGASNNRLLFTSSSNTSAIMNTQVPFPKNHKLLFKLSTDLSNLLKVRLYNNSWVTLLPPTELIKSGDFQYLVINPLSDDARILYIIPSVDDNVQHYIYNVQVFDLTALGIDNLTNNEVLEWFTDYFPLPYYSYNSGSLLSFNGTGIKTVGFNQWDEEWEQGDISGTTGANTTIGHGIRSKGYIQVMPLTDYYVEYPTNVYNLKTRFYDGNKNYIGQVDGNGHNTLNAPGIVKMPSNCCYFRFATQPTYGDVYNNDICINISDSSKNGIYEPYTSSTLSLPISTYFPTGMKSAGNVYDEWTPNKASSRVGTVTLNGTESWHVPDSSGNCWLDFNNMPVVADYRLTMTATVTVAQNRQSMTANSVTGYNSGTTNYLYFRTADATQSVANVKAYLQANPVTLNYELKIPTETSFTAASLVTENAEIPLSNEDGVLIGKCTEQLSENPGFIDAKIKLSDADGECYSNKIQLHVERSPQ